MFCRFSFFPYLCHVKFKTIRIMLEKIEAALVADIAKYYIHVGHALTESGVLKNIVKL